MMRFFTLKKARKKMPIGTVSKGYKKVAEGKWVKVKEDNKSNNISQKVNIKKLKDYDTDKGNQEYILRFTNDIQNDLQEGFSYHQTDFENLREFVVGYTQQSDRPPEWWENHYDIYGPYDIENMDEDSEEFKELLEDTMDDLKSDNSEIQDIKKMDNGKIVLIQSGLNGFELDANNKEDALKEAVSLINKNISYGGKAYLIASDIIDTMQEGVVFDSKSSKILAEVSLNKQQLQKARPTKYIKRVPKPSGKGYYYFYNQADYKKYQEMGEIKGEKKGGVLSGIMSFFGFKDEKQAKQKSKELYYSNKDKLSGIDQGTFDNYLNEYLSNKDKWDKKIFGKSGYTKDKKTGEIKKVVKTSWEKKSPGAGSQFKFSIMKTVVEAIKLNLKKDFKNGQQSKSIGTPSLSRNNVRERTTKLSIKTAREDITRKPTKDFLSENFRGILRPHQKDFVNLALETFIDKKESAIFNMDGTGAGKTLQEIGLAQSYLDQKNDKPVLIVTENKRIIESSFIEDSKLVNTDISHIQNGSEIKSNSIYITTYNRLKDFQNNNFGLVIFDESHNLKNKSMKTKHGEQLIDKTDHIGLFSATPLDKGNQIGYIAKAFNLKKTQLMKSLGYTLQDQWTGRETIKVWKAQESAEEIANRIDAFFTSMTSNGLAIKREVPLDNLNTNIKKIELTTEQKERYAIAENAFYKAISADPKSKATALMTLRRFTEELKLDSTINNIIKETSENPNKQIVLFATRVNDSNTFDENSLGTLNEISKRLSEKGINHVNVFNSNKEAKNNIDKFQKGEVKIILTTPQSGGTGLSLDDITGNNPRKAIVMTPPFSAMDFIQMAGRINRLNTKSIAEIDMYSTETMVDGWNKDIIANKLLTLGGAVSGDYKKLEIKELERLQFMSNEDQKEYLKNKKIDQKIPYQEDRNIDFNSFKKGVEKEEIKTKYPKYPLRTISSYETFIPKEFDTEWPDAEIGFGKYKGTTLSKLQEKDPGYMRWMLSNISSKYSSLVGNIKFIDNLTKAIRYTLENMQKSKYEKKSLQKAKPVPTGSISKSGKYKKVAEGKWVKIKDGKEKSGKEGTKGKEKTSDKKNEKGSGSQLSEKDRGIIKNALKKMATFLADALSGKDTVQPTGAAVEEVGQNIDAKRQQAKQQKKQNKSK